MPRTRTSLVLAASVLVALPAPGGARAGQGPTADAPAALRKPSSDDARPLGPRTVAAPAPASSGVRAIGPTLVVGGLGLVALAAFALLRRSSGGNLARAAGPFGSSPSGILSILGRYPIGGGVTLILLKLDRRVLLIAQSGAGRLVGRAVRTLSEITDASSVASIVALARDAAGVSSSAAFGAALRSAESDEPAPAPARADRVLDRVEIAPGAPDPDGVAAERLRRRLTGWAPERRSPSRGGPA